MWGYMNFLDRYIQFLNQLEDVAKNHDELTDTDVRERLREVINYYLIWENPIEPEFPQRFSMLTSEADRQVRGAVHSFVVDATQCAEMQEAELGQSRHSLIEDERAISSTGESYWLFLGFSEDVLSMEKPAPDEIFDYFND